MDEFSVSVIQFDDGGRHSPAEDRLRRHGEEDMNRVDVMNRTNIMNRVIILNISTRAIVLNIMNQIASI